MDIKKIFKDEIAKAMEHAKCTELSNLHVAWNDEKKVLAVIEKNSKKNTYEVSAIKVFLKGEKMQKISETTTTSNSESLASILSTKIHNVSREMGEGVAIRDRYTCLHMLFTVQEEYGKTQPMSSFPQIPQTMERTSYDNVIAHVCNQHLEPTNTPIPISEPMLYHHLLITGMTGSAKTGVAKKICTEVKRMGKKVLVVTPQPHQWLSMEDAYVLKDVDKDLHDAINILDIQNFMEDVDIIEETLSSIFNYYSSLGETKSLRIVILFDETHRLLKVKKLEEILDSASREVRKYGVGLVFISQFCVDFETSIRGDIHTHIGLRCKRESDISYIKRNSNIPRNKYEQIEQLRYIPNGYGIFYSDFFNNSIPFFCKFLRYDEDFQTIRSHEVTEQEDVRDGDETYRRRMAIHEIVKKNPPATQDFIVQQLSDKGMGVTDRTVYTDLDWLEKTGRIVLKGKGERGKKYYVGK